MKELKSLLLLRILDSEFYHLKEQIKFMKQSDIDSEKMRSMINSYLIQTVKLSVLTVILSSANFANKNKQKADQENQSEDQSDQFR